MPARTTKKFTPEIDAQLYDEFVAVAEQNGQTKRHVLEQALGFYLHNVVPSQHLVRPEVMDAFEQSVAAMQAVHFLGIPEGDLALAQAAIYLCVAPKSDAAYRAMDRVHEDVEKTIAEPVPMNLRNAPTRDMKAWGYGAGYQHAHKFEDAVPDMECLPPSLAGNIISLQTVD